MEQETQRQITERLSSTRVALGERATRQLEVAQEKLASGELLAFYPFVNKEQSRALFELLGCNEVYAEQVLGYQYQSTYGANTYESGDTIKFRGPLRINQLLFNLGNIGAADDFPNNFRVGVAIALDDETVTIIRQEVDEQPNICVGCEDDKTYSSGENSCDHENDEITTSHVVYLQNRVDAAEIKQLLQDLL